MNFITEKNFVDGAWIHAAGGQSREVVNPATGEVIGTITWCAANEAESAIEAAHRAFPDWAAKTAYERADILMRWHDLIVDNLDALAQTLVAENGKPLAQARAEVTPSNIKWYAEEAKRVYGRIVPSHVPGQQVHVTRQPIGVAAMITPWNFPSAMITRKASAALAAGCTVVLKPDHRTPYSALALAQLAEQAGFPKGVFNVITGDAETLGEVFTAHPLVRKISFTGSTRVGRLLMAQCAPTIKKLSLELGGNAPFIVCASADVDHAVDLLFAAKIRNAGQTCISPNRIFVHDTLYDAFAEKLAARMRALVVGDGRDEAVHIGPLIDAAAMEKVTRLVKAAVDKGARCLLGGKPHALNEKNGGGTFFEPTVLADVSPDMELSCEEIFGPVAALQRFSDEDDVIKRANNTIFGLASYIVTNDAAQMQRLMAALEYGMVGVNTAMISLAQAPFGGMKQSGMGREGGIEGLEAFLETKYCVIQG